MALLNHIICIYVCSLFVLLFRISSHVRLVSEDRIGPARLQGDNTDSHMVTP